MQITVPADMPTAEPSQALNIKPALDLLARAPLRTATLRELAAACGLDTSGPASWPDSCELRAALLASPSVLVETSNKTWEDRYVLRSTPEDRRHDSIASAIRVMVLSAASAYADALADYWISRRDSDDVGANERCRRASSDGISLSTAFACYVSTGRSPVEYLRDYPTSEVDTKAQIEALAAELEAKLAAPPQFIEPGHEQD